MPKQSWALAMVLAGGILAGTATANDEIYPNRRPCGNQVQSAEGAIPDAARPGDQSEAEQPAILDRRDRIFYPGDTERAKPLLRKLLLNIALDQKDIFTSPFHINRNNALEWLVPTAITGALIPADTHIGNAFENSRGQLRWGGRISQIGASYTLLPIIGGSYIYGAWRDNAKAREIGVLGTESLLDSLIVVGVAKEVFRRNRPQDRHAGDFWGGGTSFPSGHSIQMWTVASLLAHEYQHKKVIAITAYSLAGIVSASRVAAQRHFASDVFAGGAMGWFIGRYVYDTHMSHLAHKHASLVPMIVPEADPRERRYGLRLVFGRGPTSDNGSEDSPRTAEIR
ncbi:MAG: phosphatase PAP2 family protein [Acidobacteria bacterium]|nr:phosphatase PAP2 family protein [Acidobacteriota bacterium]